MTWSSILYKIKNTSYYTNFWKIFKDTKYLRNHVEINVENRADLIDIKISVKINVNIIPGKSYRLKIHSERVRGIPSHSESCLWTIRMHSELIRKTLWIPFDVKRLKINPTWSYSIRFNTNESESIRISLAGEGIGSKFIPSQSELFRFIPISVSEPMRIIPNHSEKRFVTRLKKNGKKIRPWIHWKFSLDQSGLGLIRIENLVSDWFRFSRIVDSD